MPEQAVQDTTETVEDVPMEDVLYGDKEKDEPEEEESKEEDAPSEDAEEVSEDKEDEKEEEEETKESKDSEDTDEYEFDVPKDISDEQLEKIAAYASERGLSNEDAQKLLDSQGEAVSEYKDGRQKAEDALTEEWGRELKNDSYFGGDDFDTNVELVRKVMDKYGDEGLRDHLEKLGTGNHPGFVKMLLRIGKASSNDSLIKGKTEVKKVKALEDYFYPESKD